MATKMDKNYFGERTVAFGVIHNMSAIDCTYDHDHTTHEMDFKLAQSKILKFCKIILLRGIVST